MINYINGNVEVSIDHDGSKTRIVPENPYILHPESIDVKITNYCDLGCAYCHESSTTRGLHGDLSKLLEVLAPLPNGVELAIGGGHPMSHPKVEDFIQEASKKWILNLTVNQGHIFKEASHIKEWQSQKKIWGLGISITSNNFSLLEKVYNENTVFHLIAGIHSPQLVQKLNGIFPGAKCLILGYKEWGFGLNCDLPEVKKNIQSWKWSISKMITQYHLSFDNLAIEQLDLKRLFTPQGWNKYYMGDDFTYTMYIDAVKGEYSPTSRNPLREKWDTSLLEWFQKNKSSI